MQDLENAVRELLNMVADQAVIDELAKANAEIARLQDELSQEKTARDAWKETANRWRDSFSVELVAERAEIERLRGELASANEDLNHLTNQKEMSVQTLREIYDAAGIPGPPLSSSTDIAIRKLRDHEAAVRFKREVADIAGTGSHNCDEIRDALKAKVSQLTIQAKNAAEFRAAWAKLKGMLE